MRSKPIICKFALGFIFLSCGLVQAKAQHQVRIYVGELVGVGPTQPIEQLTQALKRDKTSSQFRVVWSDFGTMGGCKATVLYDRKRHTLKHYASGSRKISEEPEKWIAEQQASIYYSVNDQIIYRLQNRVKGQTAYTSEDAYFSELASFGCRKEGIVYKARHFRP